MGVREESLTKLDAFAGLRNLSKESAVPPGTLRDAVNVDLSREGKLSSREGYSEVLAPCGNGHSLWSHDLLPFALFADGGELRAFHSDTTVEAVRDGLSPGLPISYALVNSDVFWSNGIDSGMVTPALEAEAWACEQPAGQPDLVPLEEGALRGQVQVCIVFVDRIGRESGATVAAAAVAAGGIRLRSIPQPSNAARTPRIRIYAGAGDDTALMLAAEVRAGTTEHDLIAAPKGRAIATQFLSPMPPGQIVRYWNGRQLVARGRGVVWSQALRYGLTHAGHNHVAFPARVDMMEPVGDGTEGAGVYVAAGPRTYFMAGGDPGQWRQAGAFAHGAVPGSACVMPASVWGLETKQLVPAWLARNGEICVGLPGGTVVSYGQGQNAAPIGERAASMLRDSDGIMRFITAIRGATPHRMAVADTAIARVYDENGRLKA